jgi:hypothetical protein
VIEAVTADDVLPAWSDWTEDLPASVITGGRILRFPPMPDLPPCLSGQSCLCGQSFVVVEVKRKWDPHNMIRLSHPVIG